MFHKLPDYDPASFEKCFSNDDLTTFTALMKWERVDFLGNSHLLHKAARANAVKCLFHLVGRQYPLEVLDEDDETALEKSLFSGSMTFSVLTEAGANVNHANKNGRTILMLVVRMETDTGAEVIDFFSEVISHGAIETIHAVDDQGQTAAHKAALCGRFQFIERLYYLGADLSRPDHHGKTVYDCLEEAEADEVVLARCQSLVVSGVTERQQARYWIQKNDGNILEALLGDRLGEVLKANDPDGIYLTHEAIFHTDMIEFLKTNHALAKNRVNAAGARPLEVLIRMGVSSLAEMNAFSFFLDQHPNLNGCTEDGVPYVLLAMSLGRVEMLDELLKRGANLSLYTEMKEESEEHGYSVFLQALKMGDFEKVRALAKGGANLLERDENGDTVFHLLERIRDKTFEEMKTMAAFLLEEGASLILQNAQQEPAYAAFERLTVTPRAYPGYTRAQGIVTVYTA